MQGIVAIAPPMPTREEADEGREESEPSSRLERDLVGRSLEGDGRAFADLVRPHLAVLYRIASRTCGDSALAEDAVQEALARAHRDLARYRPGTSLRAFLAAIAVARAKTLLRSERRRRARERLAPPPSPGPTPTQALDAARAARRIRQELASMPAKRRAVALLRLDGRLGYAEIAAALGTSEGSARVLAHLAMRSLRKRLADLVEEAEE